MPWIQSWLWLGAKGRTGRFFGLDAIDGKILWRQAMGEPSIVVPGAASPDGFVFVSTKDEVIAIRAQDGSRAWSTSLTGVLGDIDGSSMAVGHGLVVVSDRTLVGWGLPSANSLAALDFDTGKIRWSLPWRFAGGVVPLPHGQFLTGSKPSWGCGIDGFTRIFANGETQFLPGSTSSDCSDYEAAFSVMSDSLCISGSGRDGFHKAIEGQSSVLFFSVPRIGFSVGQPTVTADGMVYDIREVSEPNGTLSAWLNAYSSSDWKQRVPRVLSRTRLVGSPSAPVVTPSGVIVVVSPEIGFVVGIEGTAPLAPTYWPKERGDRANSACEPSYHLGLPRGEWQLSEAGFPGSKPFQLHATIRGARPIQLDWYRNGIFLGKTANGEWQDPTAGADDRGDYTYVAVNAQGSFTSNPVHVEVMFSVMALVEGGGAVRKDVGSNQFPYGTKVRFEAVPDTNSRFLGWDGDLAGDQPVQERVITADLQFSARFTPVPHSLKYARDLGELDTRSDGVPAVGKNGVIYHTHGRRLFGLAASTGEVLWRFEHPAILASTNGIYPVLLDDGAILLHASGQLLCVDPGSHGLKWQVATSGRVWVGEFGGVMEYAEPVGRREFAVLKIRDPSTGNLIWEGTGAALL